VIVKTVMQSFHSCNSIHSNSHNQFMKRIQWQVDVSKRWKNISLVEELTQSANLMLFYKWSKKWFLVDCIDISDFSTYWRREWYFNEKISDIDNSTKSLSSLWASEQSRSKHNALETHQLATRRDMCYKLAASNIDQLRVSC